MLRKLIQLFSKSGAEPLPPAEATSTEAPSGLSSAPPPDKAGLPMDPLARQLSSWSKGIAFELEFWERWFATKGAEWPASYQQRLDPVGENPASLLARLGIPEPQRKRVLDVGAGPMTFLKSTHNGEHIHLTACDPLAPYYSEMAMRHGVNRPIATIQAFAEDLTSIFDEETFDAVHCANALDHSFDPLRGIDEMLAVCKVGGIVLLSHSVNEAEFENYTGFHQWNFNKKDNDFVIWNNSGYWNASQKFGHIADVSTEIVGERHIFAAFKKKAATEMDLAARYRTRTRNLLAALILTAPK